MLHKDYDVMGSVEKNSLVLSLKGLGAKTSWSMINLRSFKEDLSTEAEE
jgi:hypothetical protein